MAQKAPWAFVWSTLVALANPAHPVHLQSVPSHCGIEGTSRWTRSPTELQYFPGTCLGGCHHRPPRGGQTSTRDS